MPSVNTEIPSIVLVAYAAASARADRLITKVQETCQPPLDAAKGALKNAQQIHLAQFAQTLEQAYNQAHRTYEQQYRLACNTHGLTITGALRQLDKRKMQILAEREQNLAPLKSNYEEICAAFDSAQDAHRLPALDALRLGEIEVDVVCDRQLLESRAIYLQEKERADLALADRLRELNEDKARVLQQAKDEHDACEKALMPPLEQAVEVAQAAFDEAMLDAIAASNELRRSRVEVFNNFDRDALSSFQCARWLDQLG